MEAQIKELWLQKLRSGEYKQGKGTLRESHSDCSMSYCCLGVLCEVIRELESGEWVLPERNNGAYVFKTSGSKSRGMLGHHLRIKLGITEEDQDTLIEMNDGDEGVRSYSFLEIADFIEDTL